MNEYQKKTFALMGNPFALLEEPKIGDNLRVDGITETNATAKFLEWHAEVMRLAVLAEREACAEVLVGKIKRHEQIAQECALRGEYAEVTVLRSTAQKLSECVAEIRARGQE